MVFLLDLNGDAKPNWHSFVRHSGMSLDDLQAIGSLRNAVDYIVENPPMKQCVREGELY